MRRVIQRFCEAEDVLDAKGDLQSTFDPPSIGIQPYTCAVCFPSSPHHCHSTVYLAVCRKNSSDLWHAEAPTEAPRQRPLLKAASESD